MGFLQQMNVLFINHIAKFLKVKERGSIEECTGQLASTTSGAWEERTFML